MSTTVEDLAYADPLEQGRLGQDVENALNALVDRAQRVGTGGSDAEKRRALRLASFAATQLSELADRAARTGRLCEAVEKELMLAESFIAALSVKAVGWTLRDEERPFLGADETGETVHPRMSRGEYVQSVACIVMSIRQGFPGNTGRRWTAMARAAARKETAETR